MHARTYAAALLTSACLCAGSSAAQETARSGDLPASMREVLGARLNRDGPAQVQALLGTTTVTDTGDAGGSTRIWCYRVDASPGAAVVEFSTDREMADARYAADQIRVTRGNRATAAQRCATTRSRRIPATPGGLRLGLTEREVIRILGRPLSRGADSLSYAWEHAQPLSPKDASYAYWDTRRKECFAGKAPYANVAAAVTVRLDAAGVYQFTLTRGENAIC
jgi:hypothetical protein